MTPAARIFKGSILFCPKGQIPRARRGQTHASFPIILLGIKVHSPTEDFIVGKTATTAFLDLSDDIGATLLHRLGGICQPDRYERVVFRPCHKVLGDCVLERLCSFHCVRCHSRKCFRVSLSNRLSLLPLGLRLSTQHLGKLVSVSPKEALRQSDPP